MIKYTDRLYEPTYMYIFFFHVYRSNWIVKNQFILEGVTFTSPTTNHIKLKHLHMLGFLPLTFLISLHKIPSVINTSFGWKYFSWTGRTCAHKEEIIMNLQDFMFKISTASQVSGEIFGQNRSKSYCSRVQPVTCCNLSFYILLI